MTRNFLIYIMNIYFFQIIELHGIENIFYGKNKLSFLIQMH
uniref:Uncharacterized protein n=1 Tax=Lepeophtheirus salmonis TaxID=72036 RepID=A0A0K2V5M0_LEPSM